MRRSKIRRRTRRSVAVQSRLAGMKSPWFLVPFGMLCAYVWFDRAAETARGVIGLPKAGDALEFGVPGPALPATSITYEAVKDKARGAMDGLVSAGTAITGILLAIVKVLETFNKMRGGST